MFRIFVNKSIEKKKILKSNDLHKCWMVKGLQQFYHYHCGIFERKKDIMSNVCGFLSFFMFVEDLRRGGADKGGKLVGS